MASTIWGEPRFTQDVDLVVDLRSEHIPEFVRLVSPDWYVDSELVQRAVERCTSFNLIRLTRMVKVDVFVPPNEGLHQSKWARAVRQLVDPEGGRSLDITSPEDILLQKLSWYRAGDCVADSQWRDVTALLRIRGASLDKAYLDEWALRLGLESLLARARSESDA